MDKSKLVVLFENEPVRRLWDEAKEKWYFSVVDIVAVLTQSQRPRKYWDDLKRKLSQEEGFIQLSEKIGQLKMQSADGKFYETDCSDVETMFRIIQSIPSPKAEPIKQWLAKVGYERLQETVDPEISLNRARKHWQAMGRSTKWIEQRMRGQEIRNKLTDYWADHEISKEEEYARLTDIIHQEWSELSVKEHKNLKGLRGHNLRDHMSDAELIFTALAELSTKQIAEADNAKGFQENAVAGKKGGQISRNARKELEQKTGQKVITGKNFLQTNNTKKLKK